MMEDFDRGTCLFLGGPWNGHSVLVKDSANTVDVHDERTVDYQTVSGQNGALLCNKTTVRYYRRRHIEHGEVFVTQDLAEQHWNFRPLERENEH